MTQTRYNYNCLTEHAVHCTLPIATSNRRTSNSTLALWIYQEGKQVRVLLAVYVGSVQRVKTCGGKNMDVCVCVCVCVCVWKDTRCCLYKRGRQPPIKSTAPHTPNSCPVAPSLMYLRDTARALTALLADSWLFSSWSAVTKVLDRRFKTLTIAPGQV